MSKITVSSTKVVPNSNNNVQLHSLPNLKWPFIALNLHQVTDSKVQINVNKMNRHRSIKIAGSYQRRHMGDEMANGGKVPANR